MPTSGFMRAIVAGSSLVATDANASRSRRNSARLASGDDVAASAAARLRARSTRVASTRSRIDAGHFGVAAVRWRRRLPAAADRATARCGGSAVPRRAHARVLHRAPRGSARRRSCASACRCIASVDRGRRASVIRRASSTASRSASGSGSASSSAVGQVDERFAERLQVVAAALAFALAGAFFVPSGVQAVACRTAVDDAMPRRPCRQAATNRPCPIQQPRLLDSSGTRSGSAVTLVALAIEEARGSAPRDAEVGVSVETGLSVTARLRRSRDARVPARSRHGRHRLSRQAQGLGEHRRSERAARFATPSRRPSASRASRPRTSAPGLPEPDTLARDFPDLDLFHPWSIDPDAARDLAVACEAAALDGRSSASAIPKARRCRAHRGMRVFGNSLGFLGGYRERRCTA